MLLLIMSQKTANDVLRVLSGTRLKFTCTVHLPTGEKIEFQAAKSPDVEWCDADRALWLFGRSPESDYNKTPIMRWVDGAILLCDLNPE